MTTLTPSAAARSTVCLHGGEVRLVVDAALGLGRRPRHAESDVPGAELAADLGEVLGAQLGGLGRQVRVDDGARRRAQGGRGDDEGGGQDEQEGGQATDGLRAGERRHGRASIGGAANRPQAGRAVARGEVTGFAEPRW